MATAEQTVSVAMDLIRQGRAPEAVAQLRRLLQRHGGHWVASAALGQALMHAGQLEPALYQFQRCAGAQPANPASHNNLGMILGQLGRAEEAIAAFRESVRLDPSYLAGWLGLSLALLRRRDYEAAADAARAAIGARPDAADPYLNLGLILMESGRVEEGIAALRQGLAIAPGHSAMRSSLLMGLNYRSGVPHLRAEHEEFGRQHSPILGSRPAATDANPDRPLRVGVLSGDLREQSVAYFLEPILEHRGSFAYTLFCTGGSADATTARLRRHADWVAADMADEATVDQLIRSRKIDVLLELGGHSGGNRLSVLRNRPAPVIISAIGYPNTTGMPQVGWRLVDALTDPPGSESHSTERLLRLDPCFLCYRPPEAPPAPREGSGIAFGSFNALPKLSPETLAAYAAVLGTVPGSRLVLKATALEGAAARNVLLARLAAAGIGPERVELLRPTATTAEHLALYGKVDIALDPFPYNGTTTTCESLWMGVPVVAMEGDRHAARVGVSLLSAAGLPELVGRSVGEYVRIAAELAGDPSRLGDLRRSLRERVRGSVLCDARGYAARFEAVVRGAWRDWCGSAR